MREIKRILFPPPVAPVAPVDPNEIPIEDQIAPGSPNHYNEEADDNVIPFPNSGSRPRRDDEAGECEEDKDKGCEALKQSILNTCARLTGMKKMRCHQEDQALYLQCLAEK